MTKTETTRTAFFRCRDIGYGIEEGEIELPPLDSPDWTGKRPYRLIWGTWATSDAGATVYLFDDEVLPDFERILADVVSTSDQFNRVAAETLTELARWESEGGSLGHVAGVAS